MNRFQEDEQSEKFILNQPRFENYNNSNNPNNPDNSNNSQLPRSFSSSSRSNMSISSSNSPIPPRLEGKEVLELSVKLLHMVLKAYKTVGETVLS